MYELNKEKFGAFVASLRKEKGYTQKQLADLLHTSNKAVSKWETGVTIPDVTLLVPLSEALGITVTELLNCRKMSQEAPMDSRQTEDLVKTVIGLSENDQRKYRPDRFKRGIQLFLCALTGAVEIWLMRQLGFSWEELSLALLTMMSLMAIFGLYFCVFARDRLPKYYDENRISSFSDGIVRMNIPGVYFNNCNWPYIVRAGQLWAMIGLVGSPALYFICRSCFPLILDTAWIGLILLVTLGGLFLPMMILGRKYEYAPEQPRPVSVKQKDWIWIGACFGLILAMCLTFSLTGLASSGSGTRMGWMEGKTRDSWTADYSYFRGYQQRIVNIEDDPTLLHLEASTQDGTFGILITDSDGTSLFQEDFSEPVSLDIPIPGKVRVRVTGDGIRGSFSMTW